MCARHGEYSGRTREQAGSQRADCSFPRRALMSWLEEVACYCNLNTNYYNISSFHYFILFGEVAC